MTIEELLENFAVFDDWEGRYGYLIDLGRHLPPMPVEAKTEENRVRGCISQAWMTLAWDGAGKLAIAADSDAQIVRGLVAVVYIIYNGKTRDEISKIDMDGIFRQLGLDSHLSPNRRNGFFSMIERIRAFTASGT